MTNDNLLPLNDNQKKLYQAIMKECGESWAVDLSYDELFAVLDRVKFAYLLSYAEYEGIIKFVRKKVK